MPTFSSARKGGAMRRRPLIQLMDKPVAAAEFSNKASQLSSGAVMDDGRDYFRRRAAEELAAAEQASSSTAANIHRELAERLLARAGDDTAVVHGWQERTAQ
jgi:hypothetical protein